MEFKNILYFTIIVLLSVMRESTQQFSGRGSKNSKSSGHQVRSNESSTQGNFFFPAKDTNKNRENTNNRTAIEDKRLCKENELLYPGDQEGDWTCDCKPGFLYHPSSTRCYEAYTQGPCNFNELLVFNSAHRALPYCITNECQNGKVPFKNECHRLHSKDACLDYQKLIGKDVFLAPDPTTLVLTCADYDFEYECVDRCCRGSKRDFRVKEICARPK